MTEWIENMGNWFLENFETIVLWLQSTGVLSIVSAIVVLVKQIKATKTTNSQVEALNSTVESNNAVAESITDLQAETEKLQETSSEQAYKMNEIVTSADTILNKINSMFDMFSLVYQTIKNEDTRTAVNTIITNARYKETATREELLKQIESLQEEVQKMTEETTSKVEAVVEKTKQTLTGETSSSSTSTSSTTVESPRG